MGSLLLHLKEVWPALEPKKCRFWSLRFMGWYVLLASPGVLCENFFVAVAVHPTIRLSRPRRDEPVFERSICPFLLGIILTQSPRVWPASGAEELRGALLPLGHNKWHLPQHSFHLRKSRVVMEVRGSEGHGSPLCLLAHNACPSWQMNQTQI